MWEFGEGGAKAAGAVELPGPVWSVAVSPDGKFVVTAGDKGVTRLWEFRDGKLDAPTGLSTGGKGVTSVGFSADGTLVGGLLLSSKTEDRVVVWGRDGAKAREIVPDLHVTAVAFAPDGRHLAAVAETGTLLIRLPK